MTLNGATVGLFEHFPQTMNIVLHYGPIRSIHPESDDEDDDDVPILTSSRNQSNNQNGRNSVDENSTLNLSTISGKSEF